MAMGIRKHYKKRKKKNISGEHQVLLLVEQDYQEQEGNLKPDTGVKKGTGEDNETQGKTKMWRNGGKTKTRTKTKHMRNQCKTGCGGHLKTEKSK